MGRQKCYYQDTLIICDDYILHKIMNTGVIKHKIYLLLSELLCTFAHINQYNFMR